jgi:hypothetical protein
MGMNVRAINLLRLRNPALNFKSGENKLGIDGQASITRVSSKGQILVLLSLYSV